MFRRRAWLPLTVLQTTATTHFVCCPWLMSSIVVAVVMTLLVRVGLVALMATLFASFVLIDSPITLNVHACYVRASGFTVLLTAAPLLFGFVNARAGQPLFGHRLIPD